MLGAPQLTTESFPSDLDTTALALSMLLLDREMVESVMDEMLAYVSEDAIIMVRSPKPDSITCADLLRQTLIDPDPESTPWSA